MGGDRRRYVNLKGLRVFEACARLGSFTKAAEELFLTQSAVSKQIKTLEEGMGFALFERAPGGLAQTEQGLRLGNHLSNMFDELDALVEDLARGDPSAPLVVSCEPTICLKFLVPALPEIEAETGLKIRVLAGGGPVDFRRDHVDLAIRRNDFPIDPELHVMELGPELMGPVHAREFAPVKIVSSTRPDAWTRWGRAATDREHWMKQETMWFEHHYLALEAAEAGLGVAMMSSLMVMRSLQAGRLSAPEGFSPDGSKYLLLSRKPIGRDQRMQSFFEWMSKQVGDALRLTD